MKLASLALAALTLAASAAEAAPRITGDLPRKSAAFEAIDGVESEYGVVRTGDGARLRSIVTRPAGATGPLPAIYYVQPLSCDTVEALAPDGWSDMLKRVARDSGHVFLRVEKSGVGDSEGTPCDQLDYQTEIAHHAEAVEQLAKHPWVRGDRIVLYGASMGTRMAPALALKRPYAGVVVWGGGAGSWFQRQVEFQRRAYQQQGLAGLTDKINAADAVYADWLLEGVRPADQARGEPGRAAAWKALTGTSDTGQFGRPFAWHEQAQWQDVIAEWAQVKAPVLVILGDYDWFEEPEAAELIGLAVRSGGGQAEVAIIPQMDHHFSTFDTRAAALIGRDGRADARPVTDRMFAWLKRLP